MKREEWKDNTTDTKATTGQKQDQLERQPAVTFEDMQEDIESSPSIQIKKFKVINCFPENKVTQSRKFPPWLWFHKWRVQDDYSDLNPSYLPPKSVESVNPDGMDKQIVVWCRDEPSKVNWACERCHNWLRIDFPWFDFEKNELQYLKVKDTTEPSM